MKIINSLEELNSSGIYCIKNTVNNKIYIGSTFNSFKDRLRGHIKRIKKGNHHNIYLQRSINKYGIENFEFSIIEFCSDKETIRQIESNYINSLNSVEKGYNISDNTISSPMNKEIIGRISSTVKELHLNNEKYKEKFRKAMDKRKGVPSWNTGLKCDNISNARKEMFDDIEVYDINMNFIKRFDNAVEIDKYSRTEDNNLPIPEYILVKSTNIKKDTFRKLYIDRTLNRVFITRAMKQNKFYKGLFFKRIPRQQKSKDE